MSVPATSATVLAAMRRPEDVADAPDREAQDEDAEQHLGHPAGGVPSQGIEHETGAVMVGLARPGEGSPARCATIWAAPAIRNTLIARPGRGARAALASRAGWPACVYHPPGFTATAGALMALPTADRVRQLEDARAARRGARARRRPGGARRRAAPAPSAIFPPSTVLAEVAGAAAGTGVVVGGQDCHAEAKGAFTGSISAPMLKDAGADAVHRRPFRAPPRPGRDRRHGPGQGRGRRLPPACSSSCASARPRRSGEAGRTVEVLDAPARRQLARGRHGRRHRRRLRAGLGDRHRPHRHLGRHRARAMPRSGASSRHWVRAASPSSTAARSRPTMPARSWPCPASPACSSAARPWMRPASGPSTRRAAALEPGLAAVSNPATASTRSCPCPP